MAMKSLSSCQVGWAQKLFRYHFRIGSRQGNTTGTADALSRFPQRSLDEEKKLQAKNTRIFHRLQSSLTNASLSSKLIVSLSGLNHSESNLTSPHRVLICGTHVLPQCGNFGPLFRAELADEIPYKASIGGMHRRLPELQESDPMAQKIRVEELQEGWEDIDGVLHH